MFWQMDALVLLLELDILQRKFCFYSAHSFVRASYGTMKLFAGQKQAVSTERCVPDEVIPQVSVQKEEKGGEAAGCRRGSSLAEHIGNSPRLHLTWYLLLLAISLTAFTLSFTHIHYLYS